MTDPLPQANALFGSSFAAIGDINHDGTLDVAVGAPGQQWQAGNGQVFFLPLALPRVVVQPTDSPTGASPVGLVEVCISYSGLTTFSRESSLQLSHFEEPRRQQKPRQKKETAPGGAASTTGHFGNAPYCPERHPTQGGRNSAEAAGADARSEVQILNWSAGH